MAASVGTRSARELGPADLIDVRGGPIGDTDGPQGLLLAIYKSPQGFPWDVVLFWTTWMMADVQGVERPWGCPAIGLRPRPWPRLDREGLALAWQVWTEGECASRWGPEFVRPGWSPRREEPAWWSPVELWSFTREVESLVADELGGTPDDGRRRTLLRRLRDSVPWLFALSSKLRAAACAELNLAPDTTWDLALAALASAEMGPSGRRRQWIRHRTQRRDQHRRDVMALRAAYDHLLTVNPGQGVEVLTWLHGEDVAIGSTADSGIAKGLSDCNRSLDEDRVFPLLVPLPAYGCFRTESTGAEQDQCMEWIRSGQAGTALRLVFGAGVRSLAFMTGDDSRRLVQPREAVALEAVLRVLEPGPLPVAIARPTPLFCGALRMRVRPAGGPG